MTVDLDRVLALDAAATPGPWVRDGGFVPDSEYPDGGAYHLHRETLRLVRREGGADA